MQNKKTKAQIKKDLRHMHERVAAGIIVLGMLVGAVAVSHEARRMLKGLAIHPAFAVIEHSTKESETARHAIRVDSIMRSMPISGAGE